MCDLASILPILYGYGTLKPGFILRRVGKRKNNGGVQKMYIWECHNETPCITII
jgi:hypothetical protein